MEFNMNKYETIMILDCNIPQESRISAIEKIKKYIESKGKIENTEEIGKRKLAYEIRKKNEGYYYLINFSANPEDIAELERIYRITDEIMKFLVVRRND